MPPTLLLLHPWVSSVYFLSNLTTVRAAFLTPAIQTSQRAVQALSRKAHWEALNSLLFVLSGIMNVVFVSISPGVMLFAITIFNPIATEANTDTQPIERLGYWFYAPGSQFHWVAIWAQCKMRWHLDARITCTNFIIFFQAVDCGHLSITVHEQHCVVESIRYQLNLISNARQNQDRSPPGKQQPSSKSVKH